MKTFLGILSALFVLASPWVLYWTLSEQQIEVAAMTLVAWVFVRSIPILIAAKREQRAAALQLPAIALVFALLGWISKNHIYLLVLPSATQAAIALAFFRSLKTTPLIEHYARMIKPDLEPGEQAHCRTWTRVWGCYLLVLAAIGLVLAAVASLEVWTAYVGVISYALMGVLFAVEYLVRKIRFRDYARHPLDWALAKLFPPFPRV